jgi:hypothetical protein
VYVQLPFLLSHGSKRYFPINWCATLETYGIKQHNKGLHVKKYFLFTWTYSVVVLNILPFEIQDAFVNMKYNKNKPRLDKFQLSQRLSYGTNKSTNCETTFATKSAYSMRGLNITAFGTELFLRNIKAIQENFEYIFILHERVFHSGENLYWYLLCYDTMQSIWQMVQMLHRNM